MSNARGRPGRFARGMAAILVLMSVAACSGYEAFPIRPTPVPTPSPTPTPTPTPMSTLDSFKAMIASGDFQAQGTATGSITVKTIFGPSTGPVTGTFRVKGGDSDASISSVILGSTITYDSIVVGGTAYSRTNGGGWGQSQASGKTLQGFVGSGILLVDVGVEAKFGGQFHHITVANIAGVDPSAFGIGAGPGMENLSLEGLSFWAANDGTPAGVSLQASFDQKVLGTPTHETVVLDIGIDTLWGVTITAPTD